MTKKSPVHVLFIIDMSGSMRTRASDVRGGFNTYVDTLREDKDNTYRLSAYTFADHAEKVFSDVALEDVPALDEKNYQPSGCTALYDAIGAGVDELTTAIKTKSKKYGTKRVFVIIMTDGYENASHTYNQQIIKAKIAHREGNGNWTFVYLGADQDAWAASEGIGVAQDNTFSYDSRNTRTTFHALATVTSASATSGAGYIQNFGTQIDLNANNANNAAPNQFSTIVIP